MISASRQEMLKQIAASKSRRKADKVCGEFRDVPVGSEDEIQAYFKQWLDTNEHRYPLLSKFFAIPNGMYTTRFGRYIAKITGRRSGPPDMFLPVPLGGFSGLWIEFKTPTGTVSKEQREWLAFLAEQGYAVYVKRSWHEAANTTMDYLGLNWPRL